MASNKSRDEFTAATRRTIERQARSHCSNPMCRRLTSAAASDGVGEINIGEAAHICAAAPGGRRYDPNMTVEARRSAENGIWLCRLHARAIDSNDPKFTVALLQEWKRLTDQDSWRSVMNETPFAPNMRDPEPDGARDRLHAAADADLAVFRNTNKWPATAVLLTLTVEKSEMPLTTRALAKAVLSLDDLILVAAPGMGKTTTIFQVAEAIMDIGAATAIIVPLGDWATEANSLLPSILQRPAFAGLSESEFRAVATKSGVVILLDGWNEMDATARERARVQIARLKAELPELGLVISTRRQALDVPMSGTRISLLPLGDEEQMAIARAMRGEEGERLVDQAWRTEGVRELVTIPLYLTTLLSLPKGTPFPKTKEEVLRRFVDAQEMEAGHAAALEIVAGGLQKDYLDGLAVFATTTANTSISDHNARGVVNDTAKVLLSDGQISFITAQPQTLLDTLVSNHVLTRSGDAPGYSFQHQQFQEWYASHEVERRMLQAVGDLATRKRLKEEVLDQRPWTEAILFAVERAARGDREHVAACGVAILAAFDVDPILAAEMVFRATDDVWDIVGTDVLRFVSRWHAVGKVDRAVRFMITSGRHEFLDLLWPLLTHEREQVHLNALRAAGHFRPSVLGPAAADVLIGLAPAIRRNVLHEIASRSGMDGLDLATAIAKRDGEPEEKALVVGALSFRRADRHIVDLLRDADDATFDALAGKGHLDGIPDEGVRRGLEAAQARRMASAATPRDRLTAILQRQDESGLDAEISDLIAELAIDRKDDSQQYLFHELRSRYLQAFADGLLRRIREGQDLFFGADNILAASGVLVEDQALLETVLRDSERHDDHAEAAASVLGPRSVEKLIAAYLDLLPRRKGADGKFDQAVCDRCTLLRDRIAHTPGSSLIAAVQARADKAANSEIAALAELCTRGESGDDERARPFNEADLAAVRQLAEDWGERLLASESATRLQKVTIATLISRVPSTSLLPILERLLDDNLRRYAEFRAAARASGWQDRDVVTEAQNPQMHGYQWAFAAIRGPETDILMVRYLKDEHFGEIAARILAEHWTDANEPKADRKFGGGVDFLAVATRRAARAADPAASCAAADAIFDAIDQLLAEGASDELKLRAVTLGIVGARLPHGIRAATIERLLEFAPRQARAQVAIWRRITRLTHHLRSDRVSRPCAGWRRSADRQRRSAEPGAIADRHHRSRRRRPLCTAPHAQSELQCVAHGEARLRQVAHHLCGRRLVPLRISQPRESGSRKLYIGCRSSGQSLHPVNHRLGADRLWQSVDQECQHQLAPFDWRDRQAALRLASRNRPDLELE
jgi:hypothetical protein